MQSEFKVGDLVKVIGHTVGDPHWNVDGCLGVVLSQHFWEDSEEPEDRYCMVLIAGEQYDIWEHDLEKVNAK